MSKSTNAQEAVGEEEKKRRRARGEFVRGVSACRNWIEPGGEYPPAGGRRYRLIVANNCPWCHRTLLARAVLGLEDVIGVDVAWYRRDAEGGWQFRPDLPGFEAERATGRQLRFVPEIYALAGVEQRSVPILWDTATNTVVSNESADIVRMLNEAYRGEAEAAGAPDLYPEDLRELVDETEAWVYPQVANGCYRAGFAKSQEAYDPAVAGVFAGLDRLEEILATRRFLCGDRLTEADLRLFPTLFRFDPVYFIRMKCSVRMLRDYKHLPAYVRDVYQLRGVAGASNIEHCRQGYFGRTGNGVVPAGPLVDYSAPHDRRKLARDLEWNGTPLVSGPGAAE